MKILAFTDIHGSKQAIRKIKSKVYLYNPDAIVCTGDISNFEKNIFQLLAGISNMKKPVVIIHGNHESENSFSRAVKKFKNIFYVHGSSFCFDNVLFFGYGGGGFDIIDEELKKLSKNITAIIKNSKDKKIVLLSHGPPYKTKLDSINGYHHGNKTLRNLIEHSKIDLVVCGHMHENFGKEDYIGKTRIVNPGPYGKIIIV